jgi:hypothetical protein
MYSVQVKIKHVLFYFLLILDMSDTLGVVCALCCFVFPPFILQSVGLFTPNWVKTSDCDSIGLVYSCCSGDNNDTCKNTNGGDGKYDITELIH